MKTKQKLEELAKIKGLLKEVKSNEYAIVDLKSVVGLYSAKLGPDIVYTLYSKELNKAAMARQLDTSTLKEFLNNYLSDQKIAKEPIKISILGGNEDFTNQSLQQLLDLFRKSWDLSTTKVEIE
jgi:hypothetical protein